jgi:hypothetical protein
MLEAMVVPFEEDFNMKRFDSDYLLQRFRAKAERGARNEDSSK